jgi:hypothetical protein
MVDDGDDLAPLQPGDRVGAYVVQTECDLEWSLTCDATRDGQLVELAFFPLGADFGSHGGFAWMARELVHGDLLEPPRDGPRPWLLFGMMPFRDNNVMGLANAIINNATIDRRDRGLGWWRR